MAGVRMRAVVRAWVVGAALQAAPTVSFGQAGSPPVAAPTPGQVLSTLSGVYSEAQAGRGEAVYRKTCLECHVPEDYKGEAFRSKFVGGTVYDMWEQIRSSMPQDNPGSLTNEQYTDVVAYLFKLNELPTRATDLPAVVDSLKAIKVEAKPPAPFHRLQSPIRHGSSHIRQGR